jgi:hypothetical protein
MRAVAAAQATTRPVERVDRVVAAMARLVLGIQPQRLPWPVQPTQAAAVAAARLVVALEQALLAARESSLCATQSPKFPASSPCSERQR